MSNEKQETIEDIVSEMRIGDLCAGDTAARSMYINDFLDSYADRIETAWKREREAGAEAAQIFGEIGEMVGREASKNQSVTNCNRLRNAAKDAEIVNLRALVKEMADALSKFHAWEETRALVAKGEGGVQMKYAMKTNLAEE